MYSFIQEDTPAGYIVKIIPNSWQFIVFDKKGNSVDIYGDSQKLTYDLPLIIFVGSNFKIMENYEREYDMLKIRNGSVIIPYRKRKDRATKYAFAETNILLDLVPVRIMSKPNFSVMMREVDIKTVFNWLLVDETVSQDDLYIIEHRYNIETIIHADKIKTVEEKSENMDIPYNLNSLSQNPVFLAASHLRSMDTGNLNQLILDFELTPIDLEAIIRYIDTYLESNISKRYKTRLDNLRMLSNFYLQLLLRNDDGVTEIIENENDPLNISYLNALLTKIKVLFSDSLDENIIAKYEEKLSSKSGWFD